MARWLVTLPFTGTVSVEVEADSEEAAIEAALNDEEVTTDDIDQWETCRIITEGNVTHAMQNEAEAMELRR